MTTEAERLASAYDVSQHKEVAALLRQQAAEIERFRDDLSFIERWANHHGQKDCISAESALSVIQHFPPIKEITKSYKDGKVPESFDPYAEIERLKAELGDLPAAQAMLMSECKAKSDVLAGSLTLQNQKDALLRQALEALNRCIFGSGDDYRTLHKLCADAIAAIKTHLGEA